MSSQICQIPGNSDVAGIGVRASVYIQVCLAILNMIYMLHSRLFYDKTPKNEDVESTSPGNDSDQVNQASLPNKEAVVPAPTRQTTISRSRSNSHSSHEIDLKERESFAAFIRANHSFLSLAKPLERSLFMIGFAVILSAIIQAKDPVGLTPYHALIVLNISQINNWAGFILLVARGGFRPTERKSWISKSWMITRDSLTSSIPCTIHSITMAALGLYFWSDFRPFLGYASPSCRPVIYFWLFGAIDISSPSLRRASFAFYVISALPLVAMYFLGAIVALFLFSATILFIIPLFAYCITIYPLYLCLRALFRTCLFRRILAFGPFALLTKYLRVIRSVLSANPGEPSPIITVPIGIVFSGPLIYTIISTELTIRVNQPNVQQGTENQWTYGQTLALFSAIVSLALYIHEAGKLMWEWRKQKPNSIEGGSEGQVANGDVDELKTQLVQRRPVLIDQNTQTDA